MGYQNKRHLKNTHHWENTYIYRQGFILSNIQKDIGLVLDLSAANESKPVLNTL